MLWEQNDEKLTLLFLNNGTHSDFFDNNILNFRKGGKEYG